MLETDPQHPQAPCPPAECDKLPAPAPAGSFLPFALPDLGDEEVEAVVACLRSGWVTTGPKARQFENDFVAYLGGGLHAMALNCATAGLHLALDALGIGPGHEVIVPTLAFTATAEVVRHVGAQPVFVDVDPVHLNIDIDAVEAAIGPHTRAIIAVHYAGLSCDMDRLLGLARRYGLKVVEDAGHAFPARYKGRLIGMLDSAATVFSFDANQTMTTGEGGMLVTRDPSLASRVRIMRMHGISQDASSRPSAPTASWFYEVVAAGFNYAMTDLAAAIGIEQLRKIDRFLARRQEMAAIYTRELAGLPLRLPAAPPPGSSHAWHLYPVRLLPGAPLGRDELIRRLAERGIGTSVHFMPLHRQPFWRDSCRLSAQRFPVADSAFAAMLTLPLYTRMSGADQQRVIGALHSLLS
jgi:dTDP-4-amino-4,6-dideoxygalactose transaminase